MQSMAAGSMAAVSADEATLRPFVGDGVAIAAINGKESCVLSGPASAMNSVLHRLEELELPYVPLKTSHAFHSDMMEAAAAQLEAIVRSVKLHKPAIPFIANSTGDWITENQATSGGYWADHIRKPVQFHRGILTLASDRASVFLEVGGGRTLTSMVGNMREQQLKACASLVRDAGDERLQVIQAAATLWKQGADVSWRDMFGSEHRRKVRLPTYPFSRQRHWCAPGQQESHSSNLDDAIYLPTWKKAGNRITGAERDPCNLIVLMRRGSFGERLTELLSARAKPNPGCFVLGDDNFETSLQEVLATLSIARDRYKVVYVPGGTCPPSQQDDDGAKWGFFRFVQLLKTLARAPHGTTIDLVVLTFGADAVLGMTRRRPSMARREPGRH
jgi:hypothetical protein